uniref:Uncharacterized protein n=1 Tax=Romanomermis culicivorax TaxID=13658 RepID=A0A915IAD9_ROMCU
MTTTLYVTASTPIPRTITITIAAITETTCAPPRRTNAAATIDCHAFCTILPTYNDERLKNAELHKNYTED